MWFHYILIEMMQCHSAWSAEDALKDKIIIIISECNFQNYGTSNSFIIL